jgi:hypothetical protein
MIGQGLLSSQERKGTAGQWPDAQERQDLKYLENGTVQKHGYTWRLRAAMNRADLVRRYKTAPDKSGLPA